MSQSPKLKPSIIVIFGITGDLAKRKVLPALYHLSKDNLLPEGTKIVGISRHDITTDKMLEAVNLCINETDGVCDQAVIERLRSWISMVKLNPLEDTDYEHLSKYLQDIEKQAKQPLDRLFYLSIPPQVYGPIIQRLGKYGLSSDRTINLQTFHTRLLIEKPFGYDVTSAEQLINDTEQIFSEEQTYRIDHYLAKETAQNILKFRRHNPIFSSQWDSKHISKIHVIAKEKIGIENRVNFYEQVGALRDLVQSHLMQLLALTAMDIPDELTSDEVHAKKHLFLSSLIVPSAQRGIKTQVLRGQYDTYQEEVANPNSQVETFVSLVLKSSSSRWKDCIFQLTTGKSLDEKATIIQIFFGQEDPNILTFRIQPDEGIDISLLIEQPGFAHNLREVKMNFSYSTNFDTSHDAYERVLIDAIRGDKLLFATKSEVMTSWHLLQPILDYWQQNNQDLIIYKSLSKGPEVDKLAKEFLNQPSNQFD